VAAQVPDRPLDLSYGALPRSRDSRSLVTNLCPVCNLHVEVWRLFCSVSSLGHTAIGSSRNASTAFKPDTRDVILQRIGERLKIQEGEDLRQEKEGLAEQLLSCSGVIVVDLSAMCSEGF
jgi:hypothetical protein